MRREPPCRMRKREIDSDWPRCLFVCFSFGFLSVTRKHHKRKEGKRDSERRAKEGNHELREKEVEGGRKRHPVNVLSFIGTRRRVVERKKLYLHRRSFLVLFLCFIFCFLFFYSDFSFFSFRSPIE